MPCLNQTHLLQLELFHPLVALFQVLFLHGRDQRRQDREPLLLAQALDLLPVLDQHLVHLLRPSVLVLVLIGRQLVVCALDQTLWLVIELLVLEDNVFVHVFVNKAVAAGGVVAQHLLLDVCALDFEQSLQSKQRVLSLQGHELLHDHSDHLSKLLTAVL